MIPYWNGQVGIVMVSPGAELSNNLRVPNAEGKEVTVSLFCDNNIDVESGDPLTYNNLQGQETVLVYFRE